MSLRIRRGGNVDVPPSFTYGPVQGAQYIRDHAGPLPVTNPGGGIPFNSATNINTLISSNAANSIFVASATGTYANFRGINYANKHPRFYFPGNALTDYNITGGGTLNEIGMNGDTGLEVYGGKWTGYGTAASGAFSCAIRCNGGPSIIRDAFFTLNAQQGCTFAPTANGNAMQLHRCKFLTNGRYHTSGTDNLTTFHYQMTIDSCLFDGANSSGFDPGDDAACMKFNTTDGCIIRNCWSKNNKGFGLWTDGRNRNGHWHDNVVENNIGVAPHAEAGGIFYEISGGGTVIEHNYITGNGVTTNTNYPYNGVQLIVSCSPCDGSGLADTALNVRSEIRYNDIDTTGYQPPIVLFNHSSHLDVFRTRNWYVHHNRMFMRGSSGQARVGMADACNVGSAKEGDIGTSPSAPGLNLFDWNEYHVANTSGAYWNHDTSQGSPGALTWVQFKARGHEVNGSMVVI